MIDPREAANLVDGFLAVATDRNAILIAYLIETKSLVAATIRSLGESRDHLIKILQRYPPHHTGQR